MRSFDVREAKVVRLWAVRLSPGAPPSAHCLALLSRHEIERASSYRDPVDRTRFAVGRGLLRTVVADVAGVPPASLRLEQHDHGPVEIVGRPELKDLAFSVSHGGRYVVVARAWRPVGVDVEPIPSVAPDALLLRRTLDAPSAAFVRALDLGARPRAFAIAWARREAQFKLASGSRSPATPPSCRAVEIDLDDEHVGVAVSCGRWRLVKCTEPVPSLLDQKDAPAATGPARGARQ